MRLNILSQIIDAYHDFIFGGSDESHDYDSYSGEVEDPMGGYEGVTDYDRNELDEEYD